jgi:hypothetical protein
MSTIADVVFKLSTQENDVDNDADKKSVDEQDGALRDDVSSNSRRCSPPTQETTTPTFDLATSMPIEIVSTSSLRRTRLRPRRFRKLESGSLDFEAEEDGQDELDESGTNEPDQN